MVKTITYTNYINETTTIKEYKNYYKSILAKLENNDPIFSIACIISFSKKSVHNEYKLITRFYKLNSFPDNISLEYINRILNKKFPRDIVYNIIKFYLRSNVSFLSIKEDQENNKYNTLKIITNINFCYKSNSYINFIESPSILHSDNIVIKKLISKLTKNFENLLNNKNYFDIDEIFCLNDNEIEFCIPKKIYNSKKGWGLIF